MDASPLIALAKIGRLALLRDTYGSVGIGPHVMREVIDQGRSVDVASVRQVEAALEAGWMEQVNPSQQEQQMTEQIVCMRRLGKGEAESIALAQSRHMMVVLDDKEARAIAGIMNVRYIGTAGLFLAAFRQHHISYRELEKMVIMLTTVLWLAPDVVAEILRIARESEP